MRRSCDRRLSVRRAIPIAAGSRHAGHLQRHIKAPRIFSAFVDAVQTRYGSNMMLFSEAELPRLGLTLYAALAFSTILLWMLVFCRKKSAIY